MLMHCNATCPAEIPQSRARSPTVADVSLQRQQQLILLIGLLRLYR